jgi:hypothetical protein
MVLRPEDYTFQPVDFDVLFSNQEQLRKFEKSRKDANESKSTPKPKVEHSSDVVFARKVANKLQAKLSLGDTSDDFIFSGCNFYDPGDVVSWFQFVPQWPSISYPSVIAASKSPQASLSKPQNSSRGISLSDEEWIDLTPVSSDDE